MLSILLAYENGVVCASVIECCLINSKAEYKSLAVDSFNCYL